MLISTKQLDDSVKRFNEWQANLNKQKFSEVREEKTTYSADSSLLSSENMVKRRAMLRSQAIEPLDFAYERAIGNNDSVYSNFCELISNAKRKVGRILIREGEIPLGYATGFLVSEKLLLTNWHVFKNSGQAENSEVSFVYEYDVFRRPIQAIVFKMASKEFYYANEELDFCFVALETTDITGQHKLSEFGYNYLDPTHGKIGEEGVELLNIIHHPDGDYKQLSIRENQFIKILPNTIWYKTDTAPGSSGAPVYNDQWQVVGLHHMGVPDKSPDGKNYIDKNGKVILPDDRGNVDASKIHWIANEGIRISVILNDLNSKFPDSDIVKGLAVPPIDSNQQVNSNTSINNPPLQEKDKSTMEENNTSSGNVNISFPASLINASGHIDIQINNQNAAVVNPNSELKQAVKISTEVSEEESKKIEDTMDYSKCKGYQSKFLGIDIPVPQPKKEIKKFIAKVQNTDSIVLRYYHYSLIFHSVRMMPIISVINVTGSLDVRQDDSKRKDNWIRDNRLSYDIQLGDSYYKNSHFDRGHMSRREDANWGSTPEEAKMYADLTCMYTNACPQVPKINQSGKKGLWGILEKVVLEKGAEKETGKTGKISVFNGPIFKDIDPVFRGIQVPMDFYKIILWLTDKGTLKATAFKLTQKNLLDEIDFDEELNIDQNLDFKEYQCSIPWLIEATKIDFAPIVKYDTFKGKNNNAELTNIDDLKAHISSNNKL